MKPSRPLLRVLPVLAALACPWSVPDAQAEFAIGRHTLMLSDEAADREQVGDEWDGTRVAMTFRIKRHWLVEAGFAGFSDVEDKAPIRVPAGKGRMWIIAPHSEVNGTSYFLQLGYRFYLIEKTVSWTKLHLWTDASVGYEDISADREITNSDAYDHLAEDIDFDIGPYLQPRVNFVLEPGRGGWYYGLQASYQAYLSSEVDSGWSAGLVLGYNKKD